MRKKNDLGLYVVLIFLTTLVMVPFIFVLNNSLRTNTEIYHSFFGLPDSLRKMVVFTWCRVTGQPEKISIKVIKDVPEYQEGDTEFRQEQVTYGEAMSEQWNRTFRGYGYAWEVLRPYMFNTFLVCICTAFGVLTLGSVSGYVFARYRFPGRNLFFMLLLSLLMIPSVLTLVPSFLLVKKLHLLNSHLVLILPYVSVGQVFAIFLFRGFYEGLPEELFESARIDGAGHFALYWHIVLPLSKQITAVIMIMSVLSTWNNFLWPFITNSDSKYHVVSSGLYLMGQSQVSANFSTLYASYVLTSVPLLVLFIYGTKHFMTGVTSGAFKA